MRKVKYIISSIGRSLIARESTWATSWFWLGQVEFGRLLVVISPAGVTSEGRGSMGNLIRGNCSRSKSLGLFVSELHLVSIVDFRDLCGNRLRLRHRILNQHGTRVGSIVDIPLLLECYISSG